MDQYKLNGIMLAKTMGRWSRMHSDDRLGSTGPGLKK